MPSPQPSLRERNKLRVRRRIVDAAVALAARHGIDKVTAEDIAAQAQVGRATFFRYFGSKEAAVVVGFYEERLTAMVATLAVAPPSLGPLDAVLWTFDQLGSNSGEHDKLVRLGVKLRATSPSLRAKAAEFHSRYEQAIAEAVAGRCRNSGPDDVRPRLIAAAVLAVTHATIEHWSTHKTRASLRTLILSGLEQLKSGFADAAAGANGATR